MIEVLAVIRTFEQAAFFARNADGRVSAYSDPTEEAGVGVEVGRGIMLRGAVVPDGDIAGLPAPADSVVDLRNVGLEDFQ